MLQRMLVLKGLNICVFPNCLSPFLGLCARPMEKSLNQDGLTDGGQTVRKKLDGLFNYLSYPRWGRRVNSELVF